MYYDRHLRVFDHPLLTSVSLMSAGRASPRHPPPAKVSWHGLCHFLQLTWGTAQHRTLGTASRSQKTENTLGLCQVILTIWRKLVPVKHSETQHILVKILDEELAIEVPLGI